MTLSTIRANFVTVKNIHFLEYFFRIYTLYKAVTASKTAQPTITDPPAKLMLRNATDKLQLALSNLADASAKAADVCETSPLESACDKVKAAKDELTQLAELAKRGQLRPLPGENAQEAAKDLSKQVTVNTCLQRIKSVGKNFP